MTNFERDTYELNISDYNAEELHATLSIRPIQGLILRCTQDRKVDLGVLCYSMRKLGGSKVHKSLDVTSLRPERLAPIQAWCMEYIPRVYLGGSPYTLYANACNLRAQFNWCDRNGYNGFLERDLQYKKSLDSYTLSLLNSKHANQGRSSSTAYSLQSAALKNSALFYPTSSIDFRNQLPLVSNQSKDRGQRELTPTPAEKDMSTYLTACQYIFDGITDFLVNGQEFPHRIPFMETTATLLPAHASIFTPGVIDTNKRAGKAIIWDYSNSKIAAIDEIDHISTQTRTNLLKAIDKAKSALNIANEDLHHPKRMELAQSAQLAFCSLFTANTAMNDAPIRALKWNEEYSITNSDTAGFSTIKVRAENMEQNFDIKKSFLKHFKKYLKLRSYMNYTGISEYLFPHHSKGKIKNIPPRANSVQRCNLMIHEKFDRNFKTLTHRQLRKYKPVYLLSKKYPATLVAGMIQNSAETVLKHYSEAEEKTAIDEISNTLNFISGILEQQSKIQIPSGGCSGGSAKEAVAPPDQYEPDCKNFVGCIFCNEFRLHADENSVRKLLSMRFVTAERISSCTDVTEFEALHGDAIARIDSILADLIIYRPEMKALVERVKDQVEQECDLSPYWEMLYGRLIKLKIIK
ncbi:MULTISPECIES: integrase [Pseudomonas syringae group]|uniref:Phage integrase protein n=1 Tax=Pseudomonas syringae pv. ribicola TaxID=55398 RepID=A0A3M2VPJ4_PSESI|nr:integrase [Pseudomonas syringae group genomosp. 3]RML41062.1 Phage integrase protein [Pseudomonas syringae pv. ribicola]